MSGPAFSGTRSSDILQHANQGIIITVLTQFGNARHGIHIILALSLKFLERNI